METPSHEKPWIVDINEYERGWGQRLEGRKVFETYDQALEYAKEFNADNTEEQVPDWYMAASAPYRSKFF